VGVFQFNMQSGTLNWTGNYHNIQSPNFIMAIEPRQYIECTGVVDDAEGLVPALRGVKRQHQEPDNKYNKKQFA